MATESAAKTATLGVRAFLDLVSMRAVAALDESGYSLKARRRMAMLQLSFGRPKLHYEVWVQRPRGQVELGLHFEADPELNAWLMRHLADEMLAIRGELGTDVELEQWTKRWGRIHEYVSYRSLDRPLADDIARRLTACVTCLQPRLDALLQDLPQGLGTGRRRRRRSGRKPRPRGNAHGRSGRRR